MSATPLSASPVTRAVTKRRERVTPIQSASERLESADERGLREAFLTHGGELFGFARRSLNSTPNAEDVVQETFSRAWRSRARFDPTLGSLRTWLFTIERRVILDYIVKQAKNVTVSLDQTREPEIEDHVERAMLGWQMESALQRLDPEHRMIITEIYFNGRSGREVAEIFALPEGTVRSRAFYALRMLRILLEEEGWDQ
ncbi:MAG: sigma-70 family RNA polymerase sigma factor [Acidimicrobiales bacterium]